MAQAAQSQVLGSSCFPLATHLVLYLLQPLPPYPTSTAAKMLPSFLVPQVSLSSEIGKSSEISEEAAVANDVELLGEISNLSEQRAR